MHTISFGHYETSYTKREYKGRNMIAFPSEYCVIDLETTGRSPLWDRIIEIGILHIVDGAVVDKYQTLVKPSISEDMNYIPPFIEELTGITNEMLDTAPLFSDVCHDVQSFIGDRILVGYNVNFDVNFLYDAFMDDMGQPLKNDFIDLLRMARKLHPELPHHRLRDMCDLFAINPAGAHRSVRDCEMTQQCFACLKAEALDRYGDEESFTDTFKKYNKAPRAKYIIAEPANPDTDNLLFGKYCVITGKLERMTRKEAMQLIADIGGINEDGVTKRTNYLILGNNDYCTTIKGGKSSKQKKAEAYILEGRDIEIIPETVFYDMIGDMISEITEE